MKNDLQYLFDTSLNHIRKQGKPSRGWCDVDSFVRCFYESPNGLQCAARPFITNYDPLMEHINFNHIEKRFPNGLDPVAAAHTDFVRMLQAAHDESAQGGDFMPMYEKHMARIADAEGLTYTAPEPVS